MKNGRVKSRRGLLLLAVMAGLVAARAPQEPKVKAAPLGDPGSWVTDQDYPLAASKAGTDGITEFSLTISVEGRVTGCQITRRSGSEALDEATCALMKQRARFSPALDRKGRPLKTNWTSRVIWRLPQALPMPLSEFPSEMRIAVIVSEEGRIESCSIIRDDAASDESAHLPAAPDPCKDLPVGGSWFMIQDAQGLPIRARLEIIHQMVVTPVGPEE